MFELFLTPEALPFAVALTVVGALFLLEIISLLVGGTVLGMEADGPDLDIDMDADFDLSADMDLDGPDLEGPEMAEAVEGLEASGGMLSWLGFGRVPFLIWFVSFLTLFGLSGLLIQSIANGVLGALLPRLPASALALIPAILATRMLSSAIAGLMPKTETSAMRVRFLGGHRGTITQGTAARNKPAEVKIKDRHGNIHYLRVEPLEDDATYPQGSEVTLIRKRGDKFFVI